MVLAFVHDPKTAEDVFSVWCGHTIDAYRSIAARLPSGQSSLRLPRTPEKQGDGAAFRDSFLFACNVFTTAALL